MWNSIKRLAWFIWKSPQRKFCGWSSLLTDLLGLWHIRFSRNKKPRQIWVCVGVKNRSQALLEYLIPSLCRLTEKNRISLSIADLGSTDIDNLEAAIRNLWSGELVYTCVQDDFSRAKAFNLAIKQKGEGLLFVCDADISVPDNLICSIDKYVTRKTAWFPICQWQLESGNAAWKWFSAGTGIFVAEDAHVMATGVLDEKYSSWGKEDWDLFFRFYKAGIMPLRTRVKGLYHHWHTPSRPADFKKMF